MEAIYESGRYGPSAFPLSGSGPYEHDRRPPFIDDNLRYPHSGGGYIGERPTAYGPGYAPPPRHPGDYEDHYPGYSGGDSFGGVQMSTIKKILIPLAGLAILGVAAAASHNPVLLPLGTLNGRRKRSLLPPDVYPANPVVRPLIKHVKR
ncbi:uncharacterized protein [Euwallacea similis]|uniref:uncharacterized protein n=1 Tax=Euwallacea similis TaxID=1736056 RepID=UPI00344BBF37